MSIERFAPYEGKQPYIFISYSHMDSELVIPILQALHAKGLRIWYDGGIEAGSEWPEEIATHLIGCGLFLLFMSPNAADSHNVRREITMAVDKKKPLLNVFLEETELQPGLQLQLNLIQYVPYMPKGESFEAFIERLYAIILKKETGVSVNDVEVDGPPPAPAYTLPPNLKPGKKPSKPKFLIPMLSGAGVLVVALVVTLVLLLGGGADNPIEEDPEGIPAGVNTGDGTEGEGNGEKAEGEIDVVSALLGDKYYISLSGEGSLEFENTTDKAVDMPQKNTDMDIKFNYAIIDRFGMLEDYGYDTSYIPNTLERGSRIMISLTEPDNRVDFIIPEELAYSSVSIQAFSRPALTDTEVVEGNQQIKITNISSEDIKLAGPFDDESSFLVIMNYYAMDAEDNVTHFSLQAMSAGVIEPGSKVIASAGGNSKIYFSVPTVWIDTVVTFEVLGEPDDDYIFVSAKAETYNALKIKNISDIPIPVPNYYNFDFADIVILDEDGGVLDFFHNTTPYRKIEPGQTAIMTAVDAPEEDLTAFYFPAILNETFLEAELLDSPVLQFVTITGSQSITITNLTDSAVASPISVGSEKRNFTVFDNNGEIIRQEENADYHTFILSSGYSVTIEIYNPGEADTIVFYIPALMVDEQLKIEIK